MESIKLQQSFCPFLRSPLDVLIYFMSSLQSPLQNRTWLHTYTALDVEQQAARQRRTFCVLHQNSWVWKSILTFFLWNIKVAQKTASCYRSALKIKANFHVIRHYSRYIHAHRQHKLFSSGCVSVSCRRSVASVCDGLDLPSAWLEHRRFKGGTSPLTLMDFRAILVSGHVSP